MKISKRLKSESFNFFVFEKKKKRRNRINKFHISNLRLILTVCVCLGFATSFYVERLFRSENDKSYDRKKYCIPITVRE